jgi:RNA polymerase sigma-70 factor (ECF subfamily)
LTPREVCGLTMKAIAVAILVAPTAMAQRTMRGKAEIRDAGLPVQIRGADEPPRRVVIQN